MLPGIETRLMESSEEEVISIGELVLFFFFFPDWYLGLAAVTNEKN